MPEQSENLVATLKVIIEQYERNLDGLKTELRLREQGTIRSDPQEIDRVLADMQATEHKLREYRKALDDAEG